MAGKFRTKHQAQNMRKHCWACTDCANMSSTKFDICGHCHSHSVQYFASKSEFQRFALLRTLQKAGHIRNLKLQPAFPISINGEHVTTYKADFQYIDKDGKLVVEDVKGTTNEKYLDSVFKLKAKMVRAYYGFEIQLVKV